MSRRELERMSGTKLTDEEWEKNKKVLVQASEDIWDKEHPMDE